MDTSELPPATPPTRPAASRESLPPSIRFMSSVSDACRLPVASKLMSVVLTAMAVASISRSSTFTARTSVDTSRSVADCPTIWPAMTRTPSATTLRSLNAARPMSLVLTSVCCVRTSVDADAVAVMTSACSASLSAADATILLVVTSTKRPAPTTKRSSAWAINSCVRARALLAA